MAAQTLMYFSLRARGEALRFIARFGNLKVVDELITFPQWISGIKEAMPKKQLPVLKYGEDEKLMPESVDIGIFLAKQTNGKIVVNEEQIKIAEECRDRPLSMINPIFNWFTAEESDKKIEEYFETVALPTAKKFNDLLGEKVFLGWENVGLGDFFYFHILDLQHTLKPKISDIDELKGLFEWKKRMENLNGVKEYLLERPKTGLGKIGRDGSISNTRSLDWNISKIKVKYAYV